MRGKTVQKHTKMFEKCRNVPGSYRRQSRAGFPDHREKGGFYGWPWYCTGGNQDPAHAGERPDLKDKSILPDVLIQAPSSTLQLVFYDKDAFPAEYKGDAFAIFHGSWKIEKKGPDTK